MKFVFKNSEIGGEKYGFGLRATDPMFVAVFGKIGRIPLEPCDLRPIDHVQKYEYVRHIQMSSRKSARSSPLRTFEDKGPCL